MFDRMIRIHNLQVSGVETYAAQEIAASGYHTISDESERNSFAQDPLLNVHIWSDPAKVAINDGIEDLAPSEGDAWLKMIDLSPKDFENSPIVKAKVVTNGAYTYQRKSTFFVGATSGQAVFEEDYLGVDQGDAIVTCYDSLGNMVSGTAVSAAVETHFDFEPSFNYDLISGEFRALRVENVSGGQEYGPFMPWDYRVYVVVVPDLPKAFGGSVVLINNEGFPDSGDIIKAEGRSVKNFAYHPVYHTNKIRAILKHPMGFKSVIKMVFDIFYDRAEE